MSEAPTWTRYIYNGLQTISRALEFDVTQSIEELAEVKPVSTEKSRADSKISQADPAGSKHMQEELVL